MSDEENLAEYLDHKMDEWLLSGTNQSFLEWLKEN